MPAVKWPQRPEPVVQGKFLLRDPASATAEMKKALDLFIAAIKGINGDLYQLVQGSDTINVLIDPETTLGVPGSGDTKLEREATGKDGKKTFHNLFAEIPEGNAVTDDMRKQPLALRITVNQKGLKGLWNGDAMQLAETLAHEYHLHAEAQLEVIQILRNPALSNEQAKVALVKAQEKGLFNDGDAQHAQLTGKKGERYEAMKASIDRMKAALTKADADKLQKCFEEDQHDRH
jgi:hypothetical protein